ncbi:Glucose-6-phosphate 1-dehydrogenase [Tsukamurella paurometabola]|nr:Glucose-6-phosphate 1-dehydrogenase [Tsukamurella paurometabola]
MTGEPADSTPAPATAPAAADDDAKAERLQEAQTIAYPSMSGGSRRKKPEHDPTVVVLFGATGDLSRRKLLCGLGYLAVSGLGPDMRVIGTSLDDMTDEQFREFARTAVDEVGARKLSAEQWREFAPDLSYVNTSAGPEGLAKAVAEKERELGAGRGQRVRRLFYLSVPPKAATSVIDTLAKAGLTEGSRVIMEKPFGEDLESALALNAEVHKTFKEKQIFRIDHFLGKEAAQNILAFRFANGLFEPIWNRNFIDHVQIDVPESLGLDARAAFYEPTGAYKDMVVTHLFQVMAFVAMEPPHRARTASHLGGEEQGFPVAGTDPARRCGARAVQRIPAREGRRSGVRHRDLHRAGGPDRQLALGGCAVLPAHR